MKAERNQITPTVSTRGWNKHTSPVNRCDPVTRLWYDYVSPRAAESWNLFQKCREPYETCVSYCSGVYQSVLMSWCSCDILFSCSHVLVFWCISSGLPCLCLTDQICLSECVSVWTDVLTETSHSAHLDCCCWENTSGWPYLWPRALKAPRDNNRNQNHVCVCLWAADPEQTKNTTRKTV